VLDLPQSTTGPRSKRYLASVGGPRSCCDIAYAWTNGKERLWGWGGRHLENQHTKDNHPTVPFARRWAEKDGYELQSSCLFTHRGRLDPRAARLGRSVGAWIDRLPFPSPAQWRTSTFPLSPRVGRHGSPIGQSSGRSVADETGVEHDIARRNTTCADGRYVCAAATGSIAATNR
jgi:hypothetical protein